MNQPPAFQFYADDFLGGTVSMTNEEKGMYITALCIQWNKGGVSEEEMDRIGRGMAVPSLSHVKAKFKQHPDRLFRNHRMEQERRKQNAYRANRSESGKTGAKKRWHSHSTAIKQPMAKHSSPSPSPSPSTEVLLLSPELNLKPPPKNPHQAFIQGWCENFKAKFGADYKYEGRDSKAVQALLKTNILVVDLLEFAKDAWERGLKDKYSTNCKRASTIFDFNSQFNQIQVELKRPYENNGASGAKGFDRNKGTHNEGHASDYDYPKVLAARALRDARESQSGTNA